jgi:hypothetical protein
MTAAEHLAEVTRLYGLLEALPPSTDVWAKQRTPAYRALQQQILRETYLFTAAVETEGPIAIARRPMFDRGVGRRKGDR